MYILFRFFSIIGYYKILNSSLCPATVYENSFQLKKIKMILEV